nr:DeoR/GlpR family DNA-binding transcription regulator [Marinicella sp. W31]MDC2880248.1 DeoR/GlpR family DNA-binding transcription regulator [Marinicella sp. W31]
MKADGGEQERHRLIQNTLADQPFATVKDLLAVVDVSPATVRRDIAKLHKAGLIRKVFGGVALPENATAPRFHARPFAENRVLNVDTKRAIAQCAQDLCRDGDTLIVNGGTTCFLFAQLLAKRSVKIYTNSMPVASALWESGTCHLNVAGGDLYREPGIIFSPSAPEPDLYASKFFIGAQGFGPNGVLESTP